MAEDNFGQEQQRPQEAWERSLLERLAYESLNEQRKARRWGIFFKLFFALYLLFALILILPSELDDAPLSGQYTALVDLNGIIAPGSPASADYVITGLRAAFESKAKGVILRTNSPGGSPVQSSYINDEIVRLRAKHPNKPFYAVIGDVCASGCYYAVASADKIFASQASLVGSIGVLMDGFGFVEAMKKLGIERRLLTAGKNKGILDPFSPLTPQHKRHAQKMLDDIHQQFIDTVREGRGDSLKETRETFSGLFWTGDRALALGLVDELGSASHVAREVIGAEQIVDFTYRESFFDRFAGRLGSSIAHTLGTNYLGLTPGVK